MKISNDVSGGKIVYQVFLPVKWTYKSYEFVIYILVLDRICIISADRLEDP